MRTFKVWVETNLVRSRVSTTFEMPDDATDEEIEEQASEVRHSLIEWSYEEIIDET